MNRYFKFSGTLILLLTLISCLPAAGQGVAGRKLLLRDEGLSKLSFVDLAAPEKNWYVSVPAGRDLQLIGGNRVLIGTGDGYEVRDLSTGAKISAVTGFGGTVTARLLRNGNILLTGLNTGDKKGIVLTEIDREGTVKKQLNFPEYNYVRLLRETVSGTYLMTANKTIIESDGTGKIIWKADITGPNTSNSWQALRLADGRTIVSTGYAADFQLFAEDGKPVSRITANAGVRPFFFSGFQILANGNYVVANWQGHGPDFGNSGNQLLEFTPEGKLVWSWKQDATKFSSLQAVIVLDGLDTSKAYTENEDGVLGVLTR